MCKQTAVHRWHATAATAALLLVLWSPGPAAPSESREVPSEALTVTAILTPQNEAVLSAETAGLVLDVAHDLGERFPAGAPLVTFDERRAQAEAAIAQAELDAARAERAEVEQLAEQRTRQRQAEAVLAAAAAKLTATQRLHKSGQASQVDLANAERDHTAAQTDLELAAVTTAQELLRARRAEQVATAKLTLAQREVDACHVEAPYAGRVARIMVQPHERVEPGTPLLKIVDDTVLRAKCLLPSEWFANIVIGDAVQLRVRETGAEVGGTVSHIAAVLDPASRTFELFATVDNADGTLRAGMNATLTVSNQNAR